MSRSFPARCGRPSSTTATARAARCIAGACKARGARSLRGLRRSDVACRKRQGQAERKGERVRVRPLRLLTRCEQPAKMSLRPADAFVLEETLEHLARSGVGRRQPSP